MKSFENNFLSRYSYSHNIIKTIRALGEYKGKESLYYFQSPNTLEKLSKNAIIQSTESSNRIEGVVAKDLNQLKAIVEKKTEPTSRSEQEIAGYRDVLNTIHSSYKDIAFTPNVVLQLHRDLFKYTNEPSGIWKASDNTISEHTPDGSTKIRFKPVEAWKTPDAMHKLHDIYSKTIETPISVEPLLAIPLYILDFLCVHPFRDGNGRMARLLSLLMLYKEGYTVGKYISLERIVEDTKESYYEALYKSSQGWHEGEHDITPWLEYFLGVMLYSAYKEFENRVGLVDSVKGAKVSMIIGAIERLPHTFTISDLIAICPTVGIDHIRKTLRIERDAGKLQTVGKGPKSKWIKIF